MFFLSTSTLVRASLSASGSLLESGEAGYIVARDMLSCEMTDTEILIKEMTPIKAELNLINVPSIVGVMSEHQVPVSIVGLILQYTVEESNETNAFLAMEKNLRYIPVIVEVMSGDKIIPLEIVRLIKKYIKEERKLKTESSEESYMEKYIRYVCACCLTGIFAVAIVFAYFLGYQLGEECCPNAGHI